MEPQLLPLRDVFTSDTWRKYAARWDKIVAMEVFLGDRPTIFQLSAILAAARKREETGVG